MSLQVWLPLDGTLENKGLSDVTVTNNGATVNTSGKIGSCYGFDGNGYISGASPDSEGYSMSLWIKCDPASLTNNVVCADYKSMLGFGFYTTYIVTTITNNTTCRQVYDKTLIPSNTWTHVVIVRDFTVPKMYLYINGVEQTPMSGKTDAWGSGMSDGFTIGARTNGANKFVGQLNDLRIYDHCLSQKEVKELSKGLIGHWPLNDMVGGENLILNSNAVEFGGTFAGGATYHWGAWANGTDKSIELIDGKYWFHFKTPATTTYGGFYQDNTVNGDVIRIKPNTKYTVSAIWFASAETTGCYWFHWRSSEGGANLSQNNQTFSVTTTPQRITRTFTSGTNATYTVNRFNLMIGVHHHSSEGVDVYFTDVKMEEGEIATPWTPAPSDNLYSGIGLDEAKVYDTSGYGRNGTIFGELTTDSDAPRYSISSNFDGSNSRIAITDFNIGNEWSLSFWEKDDASVARWNAAVVLNNNMDDRDVQLGAYVYPSQNRFEICVNSSYNSGITYTPGQWNHIAASYDGSSCKCYLNGELKATISISNSTLLARTNLTIGARSTSNAGAGTSFNLPFSGLLSDVRIYATALSADDVKELYETAGSVDNNGNFWGYELSET